MILDRPSAMIEIVNKKLPTSYLDALESLLIENLFEIKLGMFEFALKM